MINFASTMAKRVRITTKYRSKLQCFDFLMD